MNMGMKGGRSIIIGGGGRNSPLLITSPGGHRYKLSTASQGHHYRSTGRISPGSSLAQNGNKMHKNSMPARMHSGIGVSNGVGNGVSNLNNNSNNNSSTDKVIESDIE